MVIVARYVIYVLDIPDFEFLWLRQIEGCVRVCILFGGLSCLCVVVCVLIDRVLTSNTFDIDDFTALLCTPQW